MPTAQDIAEHWGAAVVAIGALGSAATGLLDVTKALYWGPSQWGLESITAAVAEILNVPPNLQSGKNLQYDAVIGTVRGNWINGTPLMEQKSKLKSLVLLNLDGDKAEQFMRKCGLDSLRIKDAFNNMQAANSFTNNAERDAWARFDLVLTAALDDAYQHADQKYRNRCKAAATAISFILTLLFALALGFEGRDFYLALLVGLLAAPVSPIAKNISDYIGDAAQAIKWIKK